MINRVNPAMIAYRNMPKSKKAEPVKSKGNSLMTRSDTPSNRGSSNAMMSDARYRMRTMMDHIKGLGGDKDNGNA